MHAYRCIQTSMYIDIHRHACTQIYTDMHVSNLHWKSSDDIKKKPTLEIRPSDNFPVRYQISMHQTIRAGVSYGCSESYQDIYPKKNIYNPLKYILSLVSFDETSLQCVCLCVFVNIWTGFSWKLAEKYMHIYIHSYMDIHMNSFAEECIQWLCVHMGSWAHICVYMSVHVCMCLQTRHQAFFEFYES